MDIRRFVVAQKRKHTTTDDSEDEEEPTVKVPQSEVTMPRQAGPSRAEKKKRRKSTSLDLAIEKNGSISIHGFPAQI